MSDNSKYKISVIVPVYNIAEYLPRSLDSILSQTHKNIEVIVIDDGSSDGSGDIIREYEKKDSRVKGIFKKNSGVSDTRNAGIECAAGDYISFVDGDDYIEPEMLEHLLENALKYGADISHCGYQMVFPSRVDYYYNTGKLMVQDNRQGIRDLMKGELVEPGIWNKLYKREVIGSVRMPSDIRINEDYLFNVEVFLNSEKSVFEDKPFYHYILRENSAATSKLSEKKLFDGITVRERILKIFENDEEMYCLALMGLLKHNINLYRMLVLSKAAKKFSGRKKEIKENIRKQFKKASELGIADKRTKLDCFLIFYFPPLYKLLYKVYFAISKSDRKYEVK